MNHVPNGAGHWPPPLLAQSLGPQLGPAVTFATTEHFNLQTARATTVAEANGRASTYLAALSSSLIALAFTGQLSRLGTTFYAFALILLPALSFVGVVTFQRLVQLSIEDLAYAHRIALLREFYVRVAPELEPYVVIPRAPRAGSDLDAGPLAPSSWQLVRTAAGMVAMINSVVVAACAGLVLEAAAMRPSALPLAFGAIIGAGTLSLHQRHHRHARDVFAPDDIDRAATLVAPGRFAEPG
jgi:hypothetical protein